jgi:hypothetical protein
MQSYEEINEEREEINEERDEINEEREKLLNKINMIIDNGNLNYKINNIKNNYNQFNVIFNMRQQLITSKKFYMQFIRNNINVGIDAGGLTRTFYSDIAHILMRDYFTTNKSKYNDIDELLFRQIENVEIKDRINFIGVLFGIALLNKYIIPIKLHPFICYQLINNNFNKLGYDDLHKIITDFSDNEELLNEFTGEIYDTNQIIINNNIYDLTFNSDEHKNFIVELTRKKYTNNLFNNLVSGFREIIDVKLSFLYLMNLKLFSSLLSGEEITLEKFINNMRFNYKGNEINKDDPISKGLIKLIKKHNDEINEKNKNNKNNTNLYLKELLKFMTGSPNLDNDSKLIFHIISDIAQLNAHTCGKSIDLSIYHIFPEKYHVIIELNKNPGNEQELIDWYVKLDVLKYDNIKNAKINAA